MTEITQRGREELKRAYRLANADENISMYVYVECGTEEEAICEVYPDGVVFVEHPDRYTSDMISAHEITFNDFMRQARNVIEQ